MKLLNQSLNYLSISILAIVTIWAIVFYFSMLNEIKSSIDEGLENQKRLIIENASEDSTILTKTYFDESFFTVHEINKEQALIATDQYLDKILDMQDFDDEEMEPEPVRMLITAFELNGHYYELKVSNSMVEEEDLMKSLFWNVIGLYLVLILGIILINNFTLKKVWKPFYDFLSQLKNYQIGSDQNPPKVNTSTNEFNDLQNAVNTMIQYSEATFDRQKQFIENASHELQTPLAIATNKLELILESTELQERDSAKIGEVYEIVQRLIRLNKSLLLLSKIENKQYFSNKEISMNSVVQQNIEELEAYFEFKNIKITTDFEEKLVVKIDDTLANVIVSNLLKNALVHNVTNGSINIQIRNNSLQFTNTGNAKPLDAETIFRRFQKNNSESNGTGLGLAITKAVVDLYSFDISYDYTNSLHSFKIIFPAQE